MGTTTSVCAPALRLLGFDGSIRSNLARMHPGDLIVTVSQGRTHFGTVTSDAEYVHSSDGRSNLRRPVKWETRTVASTDLPLEIASRLNTPGDVVDLTGQINTIRDLIGAPRVAVPATGLNIPDADDALAQRLHVPQNWLQECVDLLRDRPQLVFYGPPGTGKTYIAKELARHLAGESNVKIIQFHPAYSYEDFFEGYRPSQQSNGQIGFELRPGPLRSLVDRAVENPDATFVLIIDELNRGNLAKIFGELYFLLEYRNESIDLLYGSDRTEPFMLPRNVILLGTMNTADRSIALVDVAMRRRFAFLPLHPSESPTDNILRSWLTSTGRPLEVADLLDELNARIDDEDFKIGPSYFMRDAVYAPGGLARVWRTSILPLLEEFHYGDRGIDVRARYGLDAIRNQLAAEPAATADGDADDEDFVCTALGDALGGRYTTQHRLHLDDAEQVVMKPDLVWFGTSLRAQAVIDAKYKAERPAGFPDADLYQMLAYCTVLGLPDGHLVYASGKELVRTHTVRRAGTTLHCHTLDLGLEPDRLLTQVSTLARRIRRKQANPPGNAL